MAQCYAREYGPKVIRLSTGVKYLAHFIRRGLQIDKHCRELSDALTVLHNRPRQNPLSAEHLVNLGALFAALHTLQLFSQLALNHLTQTYHFFIGR